MKVTNTAGAKVALSTLSAGDTFLDAMGNLHEKVDPGTIFAGDPAQVYAVRIDTGKLASFAKDTQLPPANAEAVVH